MAGDQLKTDRDVGATGPLAGLRVLELGHYIAAPFCTRLLADLGAEVIKIEPPSGDPVRSWGEQVNGHSPWWSVHGRNKKSVVLDLKSRMAPGIVFDLAGRCDALVENFRPGHLERFGLGDAALKGVKKDLIIAHISGFGQDGPYRDRAAFGVIGEAIGGLRHLSDHAPGASPLPPVRSGVSIGDSIAGLYAALGLLAELWRKNAGTGSTATGRVDVALSDSVLSVMEGMLPEYSVLGRIRQPAGSRLPTTAPSSAYRSADEKWVIVAANSEALFRSLTVLIGKPELAEDPRYRTNALRVEHADALDSEIDSWMAQFDAEDAVRQLQDAGIPNTTIYDASDCASDPHFLARGMVQTVTDRNFGPILHPGVVPVHSGGPGTIRWTGPQLGEHTDALLSELLNMSANRLRVLREEGTFG